MESLGGVTVGDVNGDDAPDIVYTGGGAQPPWIWVTLGDGDGDGGFAPARAFDTGDLYTHTPQIADLNGDGVGDIAVAGGRGIHVLFGDRQDAFGQPVPIAVGRVFPSSLAIADLDADSSPDLVVTEGGAGTVSVLLGDGSGGFATPTGVPVGGNGPVGISVGLVNADPLPDVVVGNVVAPAGLSVVLGDGPGALAPVGQLTLSATPVSIAIAYFDGDRANDLLVGTSAGPLSSAVSIFLGDGRGRFSGPIPVASGTLLLAGRFGRHSLTEHLRGTACQVVEDRPNAEVTFRGSYAITAGTGGFAGAAGRGKVTLHDDGFGADALDELGSVTWLTA
jgi:hypothetical protein